METEPSVRTIEEEAFSHLGHTRKWTFFISIMLFLFILLILAGGEYAYVTFADEEPSVVTVIVPLMLIAIIYFIPTYYLYRFSIWSKRAVKSHDPAAFTQAMRYLKSHYRYMGIMLVMAILLYLMISLMVIGNNGFAGEG